MWILILIILLIILIVKNNNLEKENNYLKSMNYQRPNFCPKCGHNFWSNIIFNNRVVENTNTNVVNNTQVVKEKHTEKEIKNSLILTVGAILVIISAIAFLATTWQTTGNFIKTIVLFFMLMVFYLSSYIAENKLKLKQTAKTFYYIALAYIPIIFLSISMFSLFGNFFSLNGEGRYIYLMLSSVLTSIIYYFEFNKSKSKPLFIFNIIFQMLSVMFCVLIFTNQFSAILLGLKIYSIFISSMYLINKIYLNENTHKILSIVLCFSLSGIFLLENFTNNLINNIFIIDILAFIVMFINIYIVLIKILNKNEIYKYIYPILIIFLFLNISRLYSDNIIVMQSLSLISFCVVYIYNLIREKKVNLISYLEVLISFILLSFIWLIIGIFADELLPNYIIFSFMTILSLIHYITNNKYKIFSSVTTALGIFITTISVLTYFELNPIILVITSFIITLISMFNRVEINLKQGFKWVGVITLILSTILILDGISLYDLILCSIFFIVLIGYGIKNKEEVYKITSYIYLNILLFNMYIYAELDYNVLIIPFTTVLLTFTERMINSIRSKASDIYLIIGYILSTLLLMDTSESYTTFAMIFVCVSFIYYIVNYNKNRNYLYIPFIAMIPHIYYNNNLIISGFNYMYILSLLLLLILGTLIYYKRNNLYIVLFYLYAFLHYECLESINYISIFILIIGTFICYLIKNNKVKDIYKSFIYILGLVFYNNILTDLGLDNLASLTSISFIVVLILITRDILKKYGDGYKVWEYICSILINLITISNFSNEYDGIIYVIFLMVLIIVSYIYKFGPIFIISLISIIINSILITQLIFGNIPWWIYVLIIGSILIGFAIYNESKDKNDNEKEKKF